MIIDLTIGILKGREGKKPISAKFVGTTAHWPSGTFHLYDWYRCRIRVPANFGRPKITNWRKIIHQEEKT